MLNWWTCDRESARGMTEDKGCGCGGGRGSAVAESCGGPPKPRSVSYSLSHKTAMTDVPKFGPAVSHLYHGAQLKTRLGAHSRSYNDVIRSTCVFALDWIEIET